MMMFTMMKKIVTPRHLPMPPMLTRRLLSSRTLGLMGKPRPGQLVFLHCPGLRLRHFEPTLRLHPLALVCGAIYCQLCYCTQLALIGGAIYCTRQRQVWICLIIYHHNTVNSSNDQYSNNTVINTQQQFINTIVDHH
jgi:hypothetical protein